MKDAREKKTIFFVASDFFKTNYISENRDDNGKKKEILKKIREKKERQNFDFISKSWRESSSPFNCKSTTKFFMQS
jgi:hypothetical protein